jgi:hypothetical protein
VALLLLAAALAGGVALALHDEDEAPWHARLAAGAAFGLVLWSLLGYLAASLLGLSLRSAGLAALVTLLPAALLPPRRWRALTPQRPRPASAAYALALGVLLFLVFDRAYYETPEGIFTGIEHNVGDLPFHLGLVAGFTEAGNIPPEHPELSGVRLTYPFLADFGVAQLVVAGMGLRQAMLAHNLVLALALLVLLHRFARLVTGDALAAALAPLLLFLAGGLGFVLLWNESLAGSGLLDLLQRLPHDYTITRTGELRFGNPLICLLTTQRSLLFGAPLALIVLGLLWRAVAPGSDTTRRRRLFAAGATAGLLPLVHAHSFAVLLAVAAALVLLFPPRRDWLAFFAAAFALAVPQAFWLATGSATQAGSFLAWQPGWDSGGRNPAWFWLMNAGVFLPALLYGCWRTAPTPLARFHLPFWCLFLASNLLRLSPWIWDNIKFLFFWLLASTPIVALVVARLLRRSGAGRAGGALLLLLLVLSGGIDLWRVVSRQVRVRIFDREAIEFARELARATPKRALVLRAPTYDSPALLAGRRAVLGYLGHVWSQGLPGGAREKEVKRIYAGAKDAELLLTWYAVDFILVGPQERELEGFDAAFFERFPVILRSGPYEVRRVVRR